MQRLATLILLLTALSGQTKEVASWYGEDHRGRPMANCKPFNPDALTCASWFFPLGTRLAVSHKDRTVFVTVTDRGPAKRLVKQGRIIDLSAAAFKKLADPRKGLIEITVQKLP